MARDLLTGIAWVTINGRRGKVRLVAEGGEYLWIAPSGRIMTGAGSWTQAIGALLLEFGAEDFKLVYEVSSNTDEAGLTGDGVRK
jgi:hypothetical protein